MSILYYFKLRVFNVSCTVLFTPSTLSIILSFSYQHLLHSGDTSFCTYILPLQKAMLKSGYTDLNIVVIYWKYIVFIAFSPNKRPNDVDVSNIRGFVEFDKSIFKSLYVLLDIYEHSLSYVLYYTYISRFCFLKTVYAVFTLILTDIQIDNSVWENMVYSFVEIGFEF